MGLYGYICAFDPKHPARTRQQAERVRWRNLDVSWDRGTWGQWVCEREEHFADEQAVERAIELQQEEWAERGLMVGNRDVDIAIGCSARELQLEREIRASEDPEPALTVYAEWLQSRGDPRGIVAALDLARRRVSVPDERERLDRAFREALVEHGFHLFGPHAVHMDFVKHEWWGGMVFELSFDPSKFPSELFELPIFACLRTLRVIGELSEHNLDTLTRSGIELLAGLRVLACGDDGSLTDGGHVPRLEQLECTCSGNSMQAPALRRLTLHSPSIYSLRRAVTTLADSELPNLDELTLLVHTSVMARAPADILAELLALPVIASLQRFTLLNLEPDGHAWGHDISRALLLSESLRYIPRFELRLADFDADTRSWLGQQARAHPNWQIA